MNDRLRRLATNVFGAGLDPYAVDPQFYLKAQTTSVAIMVAVVTSFGFAIFYSGFSPLLGWVHFASGIFFTCAYLYFRHYRNLVIVTRVCCACAFAVTTSVNWAYSGLGSPAIAWFILPAVASALVLGWRDGWFWILTGCLFTTVLFVFDSYVGLPPASVPPEYHALAAYLYCLSLAVVIGVFFSFSVARNHGLESQFNASVAESEKDAYLAGLLADSAIAANGSLNFEQAASVCLAMLCNAKGWCVAHIWRVHGEAGLISSGIWHVEVESYRVALAAAKAAAEHKPEGISACVAADTAFPIVGFDLSSDPRFNGWRDSQLSSVVAWPVEVDGDVDLVLEFFSEEPIELDDETKKLLRHVGVQLSHVRVRELTRDRAERLAFTDMITGLPNRAGFEHLFARKLGDAKRSRKRMALMFLDLDGFKRINDSLGHATGDRLLQMVGKRLEEHMRPSDLAAKLGGDSEAVAARLGGDEFTLVLSDLDSVDGAAIIARRLLEVLSEPIDVGPQDVTIGASIGIATYPDDGQTLSDLMRLADAAMYEAKTVAGNQFRFATPELNDAIQRRLWIESELRLAIRNDELQMAFAPIAAANSGRVVAHEMVLRWPHRDGVIRFEEFFAVAESSGLISDLGYWTIEKTCAAVADRRWGNDTKVKMCLDISLLQLQQPQFVEIVTKIVRRYDCPKGSLEFEFSDPGAILKNEQCRTNIRRLHELGIRIVLDRFGTGYSSLVDLIELPVWRIKLSRKFVEAVSMVDSSRSMGRGIISMAHSMGIETTVFDVATADQAHWLRELGCDALQGPWIGDAAESPYVAKQVPVLPADQSVAADLSTPA